VERRIERLGMSNRAQTDAEHEAGTDGCADEGFAHVLKDRHRDEASPSFQVWFWLEDDSLGKQC
jgi:hypothetical protein